MEPSLDTWIQIQDDTKKFSVPYFSLRICCNQKVNGELSLLQSITKNTPGATIFDVGATGSQFPKDIDDSMSLHLFDPAFKPSGEAFKNDTTYVMYKEPVDYDKPNIHVNKTVVDADEHSLQTYCDARGIKHIDFLKIDTDGHDFGVLDGLGNITVDMVQFEYDNFYRLHSLDIKDMFKRLEGWHFFYILPGGLIPITEMRDDYLYTNIFASKEYPHDIIRDYVPVMNGTTINTKHVGEFVCEMFWEMRHITPDELKTKHCVNIDEASRIDAGWNLEQALKNYHAIYFQMNVDQYRDMVYEITKPPKLENTVWAEHSKLCMLFVEFRYMDILKYNLWNIANVYGGGDTCLVIVHSGDNKDIIMETTKDWKNVRYIQAMEKNESVKAYDTLITSYEFWDRFSEFDHVLTNTWDSYIFKRIPEKFFKYDIVGGPSGHYYALWNNRLVNICRVGCECDRCKSGWHLFRADKFNDYPGRKYTLLCGGFYLRKVESTKRLCKSKKHMGEPDDVYFAISDLSRPSVEEASEFGVQDFRYDGVPVGCHQLWPKHPEEYIRQLFKRGVRD